MHVSPHICAGYAVTIPANPRRLVDDLQDHLPEREDLRRHETRADWIMELSRNVGNVGYVKVTTSGM